MAHRSKKKHLKHVHAHEADHAPPAAKKHPGAKAEIEVERLAGPRNGGAGKAKRAAGNSAKGGNVKVEGAKRVAKKGTGIVRSIARAATKKITAKPKKIVKRVKSRVNKLLGRKAES